MSTGRTIVRVAFNRRKYDRHLLIDVARVRGLAGFILDAPHSLGFFDIMLVTRGSGTLWLDSHAHRVSPGRVFFTTPGQVRHWNVSALDGICLFFEDSFIKEFLNDDAFLSRLPYFHVDASRASLTLPAAIARLIRARLVLMQRELAEHRRDSIDLLRAQLHETLVVLAREYAAAHGVVVQRATHPLVTRFLELVERDAVQCRRVSDYAAELAVTPGHLSALCREYAGARAKRLLDRVLVTRAQRMLHHTDETSARVAASLGFNDPSYFSRFFLRETGLTPSEFRRGRRG